MKSFLMYAVALLFLLGGVFGIPLSGYAQSQNQAGLVVEFGDGSLYSGCISFDGDSISGFDLLARSGLSLETAFDPSQGVAVCKIGSDGCPSDDCFCQMPEYWSYWNMGDGGWIYAGSGSSLNRVGDGDVDGWSWGNGSPPPSISFSQLCAPPPPPPPTDTQPPPPPPTETPEPQPSDTPEPEPTDTFTPPTWTLSPTQTPKEDTSTPSSTATQTIIPSPSATATLLPATRTNTAAPSLTGEPAQPQTVNSSKSAASEAIETTTPPFDQERSGNNENGLVGYAVFGALLIGLGLALTRIVLKVRRI